MPDFIELYVNAISKESCDEIIEWFEEREDLHTPGHVIDYYDDKGVEISKVDTVVKDSTDIGAKLTSDYLSTQIIFEPLSNALFDYVEKYPFLKELPEFGLDYIYNVQRYYPNQGFFLEHAENSAKGDCRVLAWTLYLNDITDGGETLYTLYNKKIKPQAGTLVIFPAHWTHAHKGVTSPTETKYIATGWFSFL